MPIRKSDVSSIKLKELQIQTHLTEFGKLRDEISQFENVGQQTIVLALGSASVVIPILIGQMKNISDDVFISIIYALIIIYSVLSIKYSHAAYHIGIAGKYINEYLMPELNTLLATNVNHKVLVWETFVRRERRNFLVAYLEGSVAFASLLLMLLPSLASLLIVGYLSRGTGLQFAQQGLAVNPIWSYVLAVIAWIMFISSMVSALFTAIYNSTKSHYISW